MRRILLGLALALGLAAPAQAQVSGPWTRVVFGSAAGPIITSGTGSPEGVVTAPVGSLYLQTDGAAGATLWTKTASGSTGWASPGGGGAGSPHGLLGPVHLDTTTAAPLRGALVTGSSTPAWGRLALGASGTVLRSNGLDASWSTDGSGLTALNASNVSSGTLPDARLSSNVSLFGTAVDNAEITAGTITFAKWAPNGCASGEIPKYDGAAWICATDDAVTGGGHAVLSATHTDSVPATLAAGDLLAANGSAALARVPIGTAGQVLTVTGGAPAWAASAGGASPGGSTGNLQTNAGGGALGAYAGATCTAGQAVTGIDASGALTCATVSSGGGGALVLLEQHTASSSASLDFTGCISSTYDTYQIELVGVVLNTNTAALYLRMSTDGGSTYVNSGYLSALVGWTVNTGASGSGTSTAGVYLVNTYGTGVTRHAVNGTLKLMNPASTTLNKHVLGHVVVPVSDGNWYALGVAGHYNSATAVTDFTIIPSTGTITSGVVRCYGVAK